MAGVQWVKLSVGMFDNRKIRYLRRLPDGDSVVLIWVMLLTLAGRCNADGMIFLTENIPYSTKMLADELDFEESTVQLALNALERLNMISTDSTGVLYVTGWEKHQNIESMEKIRESKRLAQARWREKKKLLAEKSVESTVEQSTVESTRISVDHADMLLHRPAMYADDVDKPKPWESQEFQVVVGKNRHGMQGTVKLDFCGLNARITEKPM